MMLVRPDQHERRPGQTEHRQQLVDGARGAGAAEEDGVMLRGLDGAPDQLPRLVSEGDGKLLLAGRGGC